MSCILVIEDEPALRKSLAMFLGEKGYEVRAAGSAAEGLEAAGRFHPRVIILDLRLPDASGLDILAPLAQQPGKARVIVITAHHDMETTIAAMRAGAFDYLHKPLDIDELERSVRRAAHVPELSKARPTATAPQGEGGQLTRMVGRSRAMRQIFKAVGLLTENRATVLIQGETGTGKELIARVIHERSPHADQPFITVDCATLVDSLVESELFGHEKGAFTGAGAAKQGRLELAGKGTIFFDEVGELPPRLQAKLLRFLETRQFSRVGGVKTLHSEARIIGATNRNLEMMTAQGAFRSDLLFRLKVAFIQVPPLRERIQDLDELAPFFLERINREMGTRVERVEKGVMPLLKERAWPGNVRELGNVLTKAVINSRGGVLLREAVRSALATGSVSAENGPALPTLAQAEKDHILAALHLTGFNVSAAARILGVSRPTLRGRMAKHEIRRKFDHTEPTPGKK
jgi:two-component system response regulator AtoC